MIAEPRFTTARLCFSEPPYDGEPAFHMLDANSSTGQGERNTTNVKQEVTIMNARLSSTDDAPILDTHGFQLVQQPTKHTRFDNDHSIKREYYAESEQLLKDATGASRVVFFDHTIHHRHKSRQPTVNCHVDQTLKSSVNRVHRHMPAKEVPELLRKRFQIINIWRPINHPAHDWPLALCDFRTMNAEKDAFPITIIFPPEVQSRPSETMGINWSPGQKWWYFNGVRTDEVVLIKSFDSLQDGNVALFAPHTSFEDPNTPPHAPFTEVIELRALVFYDE